MGNFARKEFRTETRKVIDILRVLQDAGLDGAPLSRMVRDANLADNTLKKKITLLETEGFIEEAPRTNLRDKPYRITEKGTVFLPSAEEANDILVKAGLRTRTLSSTIKFLSTAKECGGDGVCFTGLAETAGVEPITAIRLCNSLVENGFFKRQQGKWKHDRYCLTPDGDATVLQKLAMFARTEDAIALRI